MGLGEFGELGRRWGFEWVGELRERERDVRMTERERGTDWAMGLGEINDGAWGGSTEHINDEEVGQ